MLIIKKKKKAGVKSRLLLSQCSSRAGISTPFGIIPNSSREPATGAAEAAGLIIWLIYLPSLKGRGLESHRLSEISSTTSGTHHVPDNFRSAEPPPAAHMPQDQQEPGRHWDFKGSQPIIIILWEKPFLRLFFVTSEVRCLSRNRLAFLFQKAPST